MFDEALQQCITNFGPPPRKFSIWDNFGYLAIDPPDWLYNDLKDPLHDLFNKSFGMLADGVIVWGHLVQANRLLFSPGAENHPAAVIFTDEPCSIDRAEMQNVARQIYRLKETTPLNPFEAPLANFITDELSRSFGIRVPESITGSKRYFFSTLFVIRKHLPQPTGYLRQRVFPILVNRTPPFCTLVLPSRYWPESLVRWWVSEE